ncbi:hypothetical protein OS493_036120 [Desmophyllum pertusum]|uniref:Uncharacterized protein n=1 Tax=Desmophyllum pertusum TaxID=174260 RepID=A0A9W9YAN9_9CNID|nr:hypothetical protein OS493_036120 [Desmophyllum pertusum]
MKIERSHRVGKKKDDKARSIVVKFNKFQDRKGIEKKNDDLRWYFHRKINWWDAATNLLLVEKRQEVLREKQREKRAYVKRKLSFWCEGGKQEAANKVVRISTASVMDATPQNTPVMQQLTYAELRKTKVTELLALC